MWNCHKNQQTDQWRTANPEMDPHFYGHTILNKGTEQGEKQLCTNGAGIT